MTDQSSIKINGVDIEWDPDNGTFTFFGLPAVLFWINPSLMTMLRPLADEVGHDLFRLLVAHSASTGTEEDYHAMVTVLGDTFEDGFLKWGAAVSSAGWGSFELLHFDLPSKKARVRISNTWELIMQNDLPERWGCPFIQGKIIGIFSQALETNCWADEALISYDSENLFVEFDIYDSPKTIISEIAAKRLARMHAKELALETEVERKTSELNAVNARLNQAVIEAERASQSKSEFLAAMNHELRTPLTSSLGSLGLLASVMPEEFSEEGRELLDIAIRNNDALLRLVNELLDYEKILSGTLIIETSKHDICDLTSRIVKDLQGYARSQNVAFLFKDNGGPVYANVQEHRFEQILNNLLSNAAKFSDPGSNVEIFVANDSGNVSVGVKDHGPGIPEEFRTKIFEQFTQLDSSSTRQHGGTGLGLAISKALAGSMGGTVEFETEVGVGSTFYVVLPAID